MLYQPTPTKPLQAAQQSEEFIPTIEEVEEKLLDFKGIFAGMSDEKCRRLIEAGKCAPHGL